MSSFFSLQNYTTYSILSGVKEPRHWVERAAELGYSSLGICDKNTMAGLIEFQQECAAHDISPVLGCEFVVYDYAGPDKAKRPEAKKIGHVLLYVKSEEGFVNLIRLNNFSHDPSRGFYYRPRISLEILAQYAEGLVCVSPSEGGVGTLLKEGSNQLEKIEQILSLFEIFREDFYLGLNPLLESSSKYYGANQAISSLVAKQDVFKPVYCFNSHYPKKEESALYDVVRTIDSGKVQKNLNREVVNGYLPELVEVLMMNKNVNSYISESIHDRSISSLDEIREKCSYRIPLETYHMPSPHLTYSSVEEDLLCFIGEGFKLKLHPSAGFDKLNSFDELKEFANEMPYEHISKGEKPETLKPLGEYIARLEYEWSIIEKMGFLDYFHLVHDVCSQNKERGPGRGSAAGCLISYLLDITDVDPIRHGLFFERFLNVDRKDLPDIDLDFSSSSISVTEEYVREKYGTDKVAPIITYSRMKVASGIKDIARAYSYTIPNNDGGFTTYDYGNLTNQVKVPYVRQTARGREELEERLQYENFESFYQKHSKWVENVVLPLQETVTNDGIHAAGTIITHLNHDECLPLKYNSKNSVFVSQWKDKDCEKRGFPKFDFLTIDALDIIKRARNLIEKRHGISLPHRREIPLDDARALSVFQDVKTDGVFQFNTFAQKMYLGLLKPKSFDDLVAAVALVRPGPMLEEIHIHFAEVKNGERALVYDHPDLEPVLGSTYGFMIYQEQMMEIVKTIGGLNGAEAERVRRACGKKKKEEMDLWEERFKGGAVSRGYSADFASNLWNKIVKFAEYSFNLSHSVSYTKISYEQAYLKSRWPLEYWAAALSYSSSDAARDNSAVNVKYQAVEEGVEFIYPNIFAFSDDYTPHGERSILWPLSRIKGLGSKAVEELTRGGRTSFSSMEEMVKTLSNRVLNKRVYHALIASGFFDPLYTPWEAAQEYYRIRGEEVPYEMAHKNKFAWYKLRNEAFGMIVKPWKEVAPFNPKVQRFPGVTLSNKADGKNVFIGGYIQDLRIKRSKRGDWFAKATIIDDGEEFDVKFWSSFWENEILDIEGRRPKVGQLVELIGTKESWNDRSQVTVGHPNAYVKIVWDDKNFQS
jgi:DNA polymerase III subunit alpha